MPRNAKFYGNVMGIEVGSPDDPQDIGEWFPDGRYAPGFVRRGLPSEMFLDRLISPIREGREDGYLPSAPMAIREFAPDYVLTDADLREMRAEDAQRQRDYLRECEDADRRKQRSLRISKGNALGSFTGPPDRVRR